MRQPALAIFPRTDLEFVAMVYALLVDHADPVELQSRLRETYPLAVVRPRVISSEPTTLWYVYRDGRWNPDLPVEGSTPG
jgi:hypothetical protein